jgi:FimV-like protein
MMIAGIGGVGILGVLGTLLYRRKRRDNDEMLDIIDESEFIDDEDDEAYFQSQRAASNQASAQSGFSGAARGAAGASGVVGGDALAGLAGGREVGSEPASKAGAEKRSIDFDEMADSSLAFGSETQAVANASGEHDLDKDDTISEVDVYLAYGLHGQAEELLTRAIERAPDNPRYARKLLQTYHAQGNGEGFHSTAAEFHARFGGEDNPEWPAIAAMGAELKPDDPLYASARDVISAIGVGHSNGQALSDDDFLPALDEESGSFNRNFRSSSDAVDMREDESSLMDHSLDPAFAFDEGDLEATGDFTGIASELAAEENDGGIDFPGFSATASDTDDLTDELSSGMTRDGDLLGDALTLDELDRVASADDLTLDLDQLSGDLELDSAELMNADLSDLDLPELTLDSELLVDDMGSGGNADEMATMLDLARAYIDMGDKDSASSALDEIVRSGSPEQVSEAETLLRKIS